MNPYEKFDENIRIAAEAFRQIDKKEVIRLISHLDADGISACAIIISLLTSANMKYSVTSVK